MDNYRAFWLTFGLALLLAIILAPPVLSLVNFRHSERAALLIEQGPIHGSGVYLGHGFVLTAAHVISGEMLKDPKDKKAPLLVNGKAAKPLWFSTEDDLGVVLVEDLDAPVSELACKSADPVIGASLEAVGNPLNLVGVHVFGRVAAATATLKEFGSKVYFVVNMMLAPGMSGGPVFDSQGVAGIASATAIFGGPIPYGYVVPRSVICKDLAKWGFR